MRSLVVGPETTCLRAPVDGALSNNRQTPLLFCYSIKRFRFVSALARMDGLNGAGCAFSVMYNSGPWHVLLKVPTVLSERCLVSRKCVRTRLVGDPSSGVRGRRFESCRAYLPSKRSNDTPFDALPFPVLRKALFFEQGNCRSGYGATRTMGFG